MSVLWKCDCATPFVGRCHERLFAIKNVLSINATPPAARKMKWIGGVVSEDTAFDQRVRSTRSEIGAPSVERIILFDSRAVHMLSTSCFRVNAASFCGGIQRIGPIAADNRIRDNQFRKKIGGIGTDSAAERSVRDLRRIDNSWKGVGAVGDEVVDDDGIQHLAVPRLVRRMVKNSTQHLEAEHS